MTIYIKLGLIFTPDVLSVKTEQVVTMYMKVGGTFAPDVLSVKN